ncbi:unnamed protein product [Clavelina lepadiformis]|uniref:PH domain-containing protein n=1 Tax=Clavelina lepadiformis TaxID=159417 RepID=A0ABP0FIB8_CLALP
MGRVRHAGSLIKSDGHSYQKYWCVVREKAFLVYDDIEHGSIAKSPSCVLPVSHLSATAYVLPSNNKRAPTQFSLELHCAESDRTFIFYVDQAVALEQWVDAIKAEASSDEVTFFDSPHGALLPPELEFLPATANKISYRSLPPSSGETTARTMKYLNDIRKQTKLDIETKITEIAPNAKVQHSPNLRRISPRLPYKESTDTSKHSLPDVIPTYQDRYGDDDSSMTSLSSPALSTPSSSTRHHNYQESADESSISSSNASSPVIVKSKKTLKSSPTRPNPTSQMTKKKQTKRSHPPSKDQWMREPLKRQEKVFTSPDTPQQQKDRRSQGNPYFYTGENKLTKSIKSTPGMRHMKKKDSTKRHTIVGVVSPLDLTTITNAAESANDTGKTASAGQQPSTRQQRLSIAPLSTLDLQINQRRRHTRSSVQVELAPLKQGEREFSFDSEDSSFDDFNDTSSQVQNSPTLFDSSELLDNFQPAGVKREKQGIHERLEVDPNMTKIQNNEGMRTPILRLKKKIKTSNHPASGQQSSRSGPDLPNRSDFKRRSGNFSTKLLNRVSSVVGKRSNKSFDDPMADKTSPEVEISPTCSFTSVTAMESGANVQDEQQAIFVPPKESFEQKCSSAMEGFLYRRKRMQWKRVWAILTSDKVLNFYKSENYEPVASINLKLGCSAENVVQDKNSNSFVLVFKTTSKRSNSSNSIEDGQLTSNKQETTTKSVHLMCKSTQEFMHWMKAFVLLNSSPDSFITASKQQTIRTLNPIKPTSATGDRYHDERSIPGIPSLNSSLTSSELESLSDLSRSGDLSYISAERVDLDVPGGVHKSHSSTNVNELIARCNVTPVQRSSSFDTDSKRTVPKIEKSPKALSRHTPGMMARGADDITSACGQVSKVNANSEPYLENLQFIGHPVNPESLRSQTETCLDAKSRNDSQYPDDSSNKKTKAIEEDTTRTTYGEKIMSIVAPVAADRKTDVDGYKVISTSRTSAGDRSLTGNYEGANRLTTCNKWIDVAANSHHSTIENEASPTATLSNSARPEQSEVESKKHDRLVMTNKAELGAIFDEKIPCDPEICNCCNLTDMELAGESSGREEISVGSSESAIEPRKQTSPRCGRSSDDKEQFSPSALFSLDRPVQKAREEFDPSIATVADLQAGGSDGEEFDQRQKKERVPSVTDRIKLFEKLTSTADDCNDPTSRTLSSTQECSEPRENTTSNFISSGTLSGGSCVWDVKTEVSDDESIDLQNLLSNLSDRKLTYNASLSDKPESTKNSPANSTSFKARKLLRSTSDSNLLDPTTGEGYRMRIVKKPVPELTKIDFIEIYSFSPIKSSIALSSFKALEWHHQLKG